MAAQTVFLPDPIQSQGHINQLPINTVYISQIASLLSQNLQNLLTAEPLKASLGSWKVLEDLYV